MSSTHPRRRRLLPLAAALGVALVAVAADSSLAADGRTDQPDESFQQVRPGIWAALQPVAQRFNDSNSVVIATDRDVIVVDSQANPATSRALIERIRGLTDNPVRYLVNTHFHSDHTRSNFVYLEQFPELEIIGHGSLVEDIPSRAAPDLARELELYRREIPAGEERLAKGVSRTGERLDETGKATLAGQIEAAKAVLEELESIRLDVPSMAVAGELTLERSVGPIQIRHVHAHTRGDLVVFLPERGVLLTGDVLDDLPFGGHGYPSDWVAALTDLEGLDWDLTIPGHGRVREGAEAREHLVTVRSLFESMLASARKAAEAELSLEAASAAFLDSPELAPLRATLVGDDDVASRAFDEFVPAGFERAFLEITGQLPD